LEVGFARGAQSDLREQFVHSRILICRWSHSSCVRVNRLNDSGIQ
jgi:hypothetical protein